MTIHNLYIFSKNGTLLYYAEWNRLNKSGITKAEVCTNGYIKIILKIIKYILYNSSNLFKQYLQYLM